MRDPSDISGTGPSPRRPDHRRVHRPARWWARRRLTAVNVTCVALVATAAWWIDLGADPPTDAPAGESSATADAPPAAPPDTLAVPPDAISPPPSPAPPVRSLPGEFPDDGPGTFGYAATEGEVLGTTGPVMRFRLAVEDTVEEDLEAFAAFVDDTLGDGRGWTTGGQRRFQRVPPDARYDFTIHLATSGTAGRMCATAGLNVLSPGLPDGGVSCYFTGHVVLNLHRWRLSVPHFIDAGHPLETYRQMVLNHEVGHALGHGHEACPQPGEPAPVMQQQTIRLDGCEANPWPYRDGERHTGPPAP
jgi:hypothetical protein